MADGRILLVGEATRLRRLQPTMTSPAFAVLRLTPDGALDSTFGDGGEAIVQYEDVAEPQRSGLFPDSAWDVLIQPDGRLVVAGGTDLAGGSFFPVVLRLTANGELGSSFGPSNNGIAASGGFRNFGVALAQLPDGQIILLAETTRAVGADPSVLRRSSDGAFTGGRSLRFPFANLFIDKVSQGAVQSDGKILVGGSYATQVGQTGAQFGAVARLNSDLTFDTTFGSGGAVSLEILGQSPSVRSLLVQADGRIVATLNPSTLAAAQTVRLNP